MVFVTWRPNDNTAYFGVCLSAERAIVFYGRPESRGTYRQTIPENVSTSFDANAIPADVKLAIETAQALLKEF